MANDTTAAEDALADSLGLLKGSRAIAEFIGTSPQVVLNLVHKGELPAFVIGNSLRASPESLRQWAKDQEKHATTLNRLRAI